MSDERAEEGHKNKLTLGTKILIGISLGIACGIFLGELSAPLGVVGDVYIGLLQMTVLPYVTVVLVTKIGGLTYEAARRLAGRAGLVLLGLWTMALSMVLIMPLSLPEWEAGTFFSASLVERPRQFDFLGLYLPVNPFHSLANNVVPAAVLFSILVGVAMIGIPRKGRLLEPLEVIADTLSRIAMFVVRLAPWGTFAITAGAAGTLSPAELVRSLGYISMFTVAVLLLTFVLLPGLVAALTPFRLRELVAGFRDAGLTAFATAKLFAVLPMIIEDVKRLLVGRGVPQERAGAAADLFVPLAYPFPDSGRIMGILFIPFAAWFIGRPLELSEYPLLLSVGLLSFFGSPIAAIPFLLDVLKLPADLFPLFLVTGILCARLGDLLGAMHLTAFTLLCAAWNEGWLRLRAARLATWVAYVVPLTAAAVVGNHFLIRESLAGQEPIRSIVERMELLDEVVVFEVEDQPGPNPVALAPGETRLERIQRAVELRVGFVPNNPPFSYRNANGKLVGLDVDLVQRLAAALDVSLRLVPYQPKALADAFAADHFDVAIGGIASSIDNFGRYHEAGPYLNLHAALVVPDHRARDFRSLDAIREAEGLRIGFVTEGHLARTGRHRFPGLEPIQLESVEAYVRGDAPDVDALLTTAETGAVLSMLHPSLSVVVPEGALARVPLVFAAQPADDLNRLVDTWIRLMQQDATVELLHDHWILGKQATTKGHRWSVVRDVLGWVD